jgi:hypothetical protein
MAEFTLATNPSNAWVGLEATSGALASRATFVPACTAELMRRASLVQTLCEALNQRLGEVLLRPVRSAEAGHSLLLDAAGLVRRLGVSASRGGFDACHEILQGCGVAFSPAGSHGHPREDYLRVCHASVGAEFTYEESGKVERTVLAPLLECLAEGQHDEALSLAIRVERERFVAPLDGWQQGRQVIEQAFIGRLLPWLQERICERAVA